MKLLDKIKHIVYMDSYITQYKGDDEHRNQRGIALIAAMGFTVMSFLNIKQGSYIMLMTTVISAVSLIIGYLISKYWKKYRPLLYIYSMIFICLFTLYTVLGGNDGFAALWLIVATYAVMSAIDFKIGFFIGLYYLIMLLLVFVGPLFFVLQYNYNPTFSLRFPFLYAINFAFATYIVIRIRTFQYELLIKQQQLEQLSKLDVSTGLMNRNSFSEYESNFLSRKITVLSAIFIDVNGLHEINNLKGHSEGDRMLNTIASLCNEHFSHDLVYRMGGDEMLILCENREEAEVLKDAQALYNAIETEGFSISYGIETQRDEIDVTKIVKEADIKMLEFKKHYYKARSLQHR